MYICQALAPVRMYQEAHRRLTSQAISLQLTFQAISPQLMFRVVRVPPMSRHMRTQGMRLIRNHTQKDGWRLST